MNNTLFTIDFFILTLASNKPNINTVNKALFLLYSQSLRYFFKKTLGILKFLLLIYKISNLLLRLK